MSRTSDSNPRVAYLTGEYPRTSDTFIQREVAALREAGHNIETFAVRRPGAEHLVGSEQREGAASTTYILEHVRSIRFLRAHLSLLRNPRRYARALALAWQTRRLGIRGTAFQSFYFAEAGLLAYEMKSRGVSHLHNHFGDSSCTVAMLASELSAVPFSFTLHGSAIFFDAHAWQIGEKINRSEFCACISHFTRSQAAIFAPDAIDKLHIVHCGVDPDRLTLVEHRPDSANLLFVGRLVEAKGLTHLFEAMARLRSTYPNLMLTIVGDGPDRRTFEKIVAKKELSSVVRFVGSKSQADVATILADSDLFVLPSYAEGVPVVLMEALGSGIPAVVSYVGGVGEIVEDGVNGFLVQPGDPDQLADRIGQLLADPTLRAKMGANGRNKVEAEFDSKAQAVRLAEIIVSDAAKLPPSRRSLPEH